MREKNTDNIKNILKKESLLDCILKLVILTKNEKNHVYIKKSQKIKTDFIKITT